MSLLINVVNKPAVEIGPQPPALAEEGEAARFRNSFF